MSQNNDEFCIPCYTFDGTLNTMLYTHISFTQQKRRCYVDYAYAGNITSFRSQEIQFPSSAFFI